MPSASDPGSSPFFDQPPERVLIVRMSHLGDVAQALPLVHAIRALWPAAEIGWAIQPEFAPLVEPFARVFPFQRRGGARAWPLIRRAMRAWKPDVAIDAQGNWKSAVGTRLSGAPRRYGFPRNAWQEPLAARVAGVVHAPASAGHSPPHLVAQCHSIAALLGIEAPNQLPMDPLLSSEELDRGRELLAEAMGQPKGALGSSPITVLHPGVRGDRRSWPERNFLELGKRLLRRGRRVLFLTGPGEEASGEALRSALPEACHWVGQRGLRDLCAALRAVADHGGELFVGDSGPAHIAASVGLSVRLIAGPEDPLRTGPWPTALDEDSPHRVIAHGDVGSAWTPRAIESVTCEAAERASDAATS